MACHSPCRICFEVLLCVQEVSGLRNQYLDAYLPPRRKRERRTQQPEEQQQQQQQQEVQAEQPAPEEQNGNGAAGQGEEGGRRPRIRLEFLHFPVTDLSIPTPEQCAASPLVCA